MIINWGKDYAILGTLGQIECPFCEKIRSEVAVIQYQFFGVLWFFCFAFNKKYLRVCTECKNGHEVAKEELGVFAEKGGVPFMRQYGLILFIAGLIVFGLLSE